ncbi:hypothetical protein [Marivirga arenosa]|uniref:Uncharacterized protein n=1 Tax=Marivirga arenosa TaxID=3059076 RepID=A0AA49J974_9BACT|nr:MULTISPECIES: hypothetical protein [unclassified Marivirga]WKK79508.1 hypothetical protein QYS47_19240 [Marivirga sp. BKB1-2]WKK85415.1 hypothetical protein QYS48_26440 [Marivirga sp. ABR2-2]
MHKVTPNFYAGVNFIQISCLPQEQQELFSNWIHKSSVMEMEINNIKLNDCVDYQEYTYWFDFQNQNQNSYLDSSI